MKALVKTASGISVEDVPLPRLTAPDEVLIRVSLAGLCRTDVKVAVGQVRSKTPVVLGHEFSGVVEETGAGATTLKKGDRVAVMPLFAINNTALKNGLPSYAASTMLGMDHDGAFAEFVVVPAHSVFKLPDAVSFMTGAYMEPVAASMAVLNADIHPGQKGLIYGDNRISRLTERVLHAKGFRDVTVCGEQCNLRDNSFDFIIETLATTETMKNMIRMVKPGGVIVLKSRQHHPMDININALVMKDIRMQAVSYGSFAESIDLVASGKLKVDDLLGEVFPLEKWREVFDEAGKSESLKIFFAPNGAV
ncbi:MAG: zinc-dependent alcohol dehydrogenase [Alphaproteobacteria bacterium]